MFSIRSTGVVRKIDNMGRIVLPKETRKMLGIEVKTPLEIFVDEDYIYLKKYEPACVFCREAKNTIHYSGKIICEDCLAEIKESV